MSTQFSIRENVHRNFGGQACKGDVAPYVILTGDKQRVKQIIQCWDTSRLVADHYEFLLFSGEYAGVPISACSTGIGGTPVSIAIEELTLLGGHTFLRIGVTQPLASELNFGELVIAKGAVRWDGASLDYVRPEFPALAHFEVVMAAIAAAERLHLPYKVGIIGDMASLGSLTMEGYRRFRTEHTREMRQAMIRAGVIDGTGESAVMFVQASIYNLRAGTIHLNARNDHTHTWDTSKESNLIDAGLETIRILARWDDLKTQRGNKFITPEF
ncbi:MAG: nucleoside phosphorylase [Anaerolineales bacterium]